MTDSSSKEDELAGTEPPFIQHLFELRDRLLWSIYGIAAVFAVLGVLPLIALTQIGVIVCIGVLLDTLLVRTVIVPALAFIAGEKFWWPRKPVN
jgi:Sec-independent protein secretion pathway component TatC